MATSQEKKTTNLNQMWREMGSARLFLPKTCYMKIIFEQIRSIDGTLTDTTTLAQGGPGSNVNEGVLNTPQIYRIGASPSDAI